MLGKYRLTFLFAITAVVVIAVAAVVVNQVVGNLAEDNLLEIAEDNTLREAAHVDAMLRGQSGMGGTMPGGAVTLGDHTVAGTPAMSRSSPTISDGATAEGSPTPPTTLEEVVASREILSMVPSVAVGLNIVKISLLDPSGAVAWSTDLEQIGSTHASPERVGLAARGEASSRFTPDRAVVDLAGQRRSVDVVEALLPLTDPGSARVIGVIGIERDVSDDVSIQVDDAKSVVRWTTVGTMGGLFSILLGFIIVADMNISRSRRRELSAVEDANLSLEHRVQERTEELQQANVRLVDAQEQIVRTEKLAAIGQLAGQVAHDIRNPLGTISNAVFYLKGKLAGSDLAQDNPRIGQFLEITAREVNHANKIVTDLMGFARVSPPSLSPTRLDEVVEGTLSDLEIKDNVRVVRRFGPDLPEVMADGEQLRQRVFMNLAANALDAMPGGGELAVTIRQTGTFAEVEFADTGTGMDDETMRKVFEPLFTTKTKGTGLGLAVCHQVISNHGGALDVSSAPGRGSTFTVRLPMDRDQT